MECSVIFTGGVKRVVITTVAHGSAMFHTINKHVKDFRSVQKKLIKLMHQSRSMNFPTRIADSDVAMISPLYQFEKNTQNFPLIKTLEYHLNTTFVKHPINPYVIKGHSHPYHLNESTFIFRGIKSNFSFSFHFSMKIM